MRYALLLALVCCGCIDPDDTTCGGLVCPEHTVCSTDQTCVAPEQITACTGLVEGARCSFGEVSGLCHDTTCVVSLGLCGDGVAELALNELCDCGTGDHLETPPTGCSGFNSDAPGATCRTDCRPARCGDAIVDPGELCDDGNTLYGDGCRGDCQGRFAKMQTSTAEFLHTIVVLSPTDAYASGSTGEIIHYDGTAWSSVDLPNLGPIAGAFASGPNDVYLAGGPAFSSSPVLWHFDGASWSQLTPVVTHDLAGVWASSPQDIYVTSSPTAAQDLRHFTGPAWYPVPICNGASITSIAGTNATNIYVGTTGGLCHYDGMGWTQLDPANVKTVVQVSATAVLELTQTVPQQIVRWTDASSSAGIVVPGTANSVVGTPSGDIFAVGNDGVILLYDGMVWTNLVSPTELQLNSVAATDSTNVFIVGNSGTLLH